MQVARTRTSDIPPIPAKGLVAFYLRRIVSEHQNRFYTRIYAALICAILGSGIGIVSLFKVKHVSHANWLGPGLIFAGIVLWARSKPPDSATFFQILLSKLPGLKIESFDVIDLMGKSHKLLITTEQAPLQRSPVLLDLNTGDINISAYRSQHAGCVGTDNANAPLPTNFAPGTSLRIIRKYAGFPTEVKLSIIGGEVNLVVTARGTAEPSDYITAAGVQWKKMLTPEAVKQLMNQGIVSIWGCCMSKCDQTHGTHVDKDFIIITAAGKQITGHDMSPEQVDVFGVMSRAGLGKYCESPLVLRESVSEFMSLIQSNRDVMTESLFQELLAGVGLSRKSRYKKGLGDCLGGIDITIIPPSRILAARRLILVILAACAGAGLVSTSHMAIASAAAIAAAAVGALVEIWDAGCPTRTIAVKFAGYTSRTIGLRDGSIKDGVLNLLGVLSDGNWHMSVRSAEHIESFVQDWVHEENARGYWRARMLLLAQMYDDELAKFEAKRRAPPTGIVWPWITAADKVDAMVSSGLIITPISSEELSAQIALD
jgi:hypothetical protein